MEDGRWKMEDGRWKMEDEDESGLELVMLGENSYRTLC